MRKALVVDDDDLVRATVSAMLGSFGFDVREAAMGKTALKLVADESFDLIVTDLFMPEIDGLELVLKIRKITATIPILLMTGGGMLFPKGSGGLNDLTSSAEFLGASFVLQKPFRQDDFKKVFVQIFPAG